MINTIEAAILARLNAANNTAIVGGRIKTIARYSGEFADESLERLAEAAPAILVSHTGSSVTLAGATGEQWRGEFTIATVATSMRTGTLDSRIGGPSRQEFGSRPLAELARDLLAGQTLELPIRALTPIALDELYAGTVGGKSGQHRLSVSAVRFETLYSTDHLAAGDGDLTRLIEIHADWLLPPAPPPTSVPADPAGIQTDVTYPEITTP